jgi:hypothetical protein
LCETCGRGAVAAPPRPHKTLWSLFDNAFKTMKRRHIAHCGNAADSSFFALQ